MDDIERWITYWDDTQTQLAKYISENGNEEAEEYLITCLGYYSFIFENLEEEITLNIGISQNLNPLLLCMHDILRGNLACQQHLLLTTTALNLRVSFELFCKLKYILTSDTPDVYADRFKRYSNIERLTDIDGGNFSKVRMLDAERELILKNNPEWVDQNTLKLKQNRFWTGEEKMSVAKLCDRIEMLSDYKTVYNMTSKFVHGSYLTINLYKQSHGIGVIPSTERVTYMTMMSTNYCMKALELYCNFFGVKKFNKNVYILIYDRYLKAIKPYEKKK